MEHLGTAISALTSSFFFFLHFCFRSSVAATHSDALLQDPLIAAVVTFSSLALVAQMANQGWTGSRRRWSDSDNAQ